MAKKKETSSNRSITINFDLSLHADKVVYDRLIQFIYSNKYAFYDDEDNIIKYLIEEGLDAVVDHAHKMINGDEDDETLKETETSNPQIFEYRSRPSLFAKGQIWFWKDPQFGSKGDTTRKPLYGDGTMRYSRHVLIIQEPDSVNSNTIIAVPLSSHPNDQYDVAIHKIYNGVEDISYVRTNLLFPVNFSHQLKKYICTISDNDMAVVMLRISQILLGKVISGIFNNMIVKSMGIRIPQLLTITTDDEEDDDVIVDDVIAEEEIEEIKEDEIQRESSEVTLQNQSSDDNNDDQGGKRKYIRSNGKLIKINKDVKDPHTKPNAWSRELKVEFYNYYIMHGVKATAKKYKTKETSVYSRISTIRAETREGLFIYEGDMYVSDEDSEWFYTFDERFVNSDECKTIISDFAKYGRYQLSIERVYDHAKLPNTKCTNESFTYFYDHISSAIYVSLMVLLGLMDNVRHQELKKGDIKEFEKYKNTINTLLEFRRTNEPKDHIYANYTEVTYHIDKKFKDLLYEYFVFKFNKRSYNITGLVSYIAGKYCN